MEVELEAAVAVGVEWMMVGSLDAADGGDAGTHTPGASWRLARTDALGVSEGVQAVAGSEGSPP